MKHLLNEKITKEAFCIFIKCVWVLEILHKNLWILSITNIVKKIWKQRNSL